MWRAHCAAAPRRQACLTTLDSCAAAVANGTSLIIRPMRGMLIFLYLCGLPSRGVSRPDQPVSKRTGTPSRLDRRAASAIVVTPTASSGATLCL